MKHFPNNHLEKIVNYTFIVLAYGKKSDTEKAITASFRYGSFAIHPTTEPDRLGNPDLPFPIAYAFGDRDWTGTEGADDIVRKN